MDIIALNKGNIVGYKRRNFNLLHQFIIWIRISLYRKFWSKRVINWWNILWELQWFLLYCLKELSLLERISSPSLGPWGQLIILRWPRCSRCAILHLRRGVIFLPRCSRIKILLWKLLIIIHLIPRIERCRRFLIHTWWSRLPWLFRG